MADELEAAVAGELPLLLGDRLGADNAMVALRRYSLVTPARDRLRRVRARRRAADRPIGAASDGTRYFIYKAFLSVTASAAPFATGLHNQPPQMPGSCLAALIDVVLFVYQSAVAVGTAADANHKMLRYRRRGLKAAVTGQDGRAASAEN